MNADRKLAVITGASSGIGYELAKIFAQNNYDLIINSSSTKIEEATSDLRNSGSDVTAVMADLSTREGAEKLYQEISAKGRPVDVLVLNAGVGQGGEFINIDFEDELNLMNLNMVYLVYLTKKILNDMVDRDEGKILFTSSIAAQMPGPYYAVYAASKAFVESFSQAIRFEMKDTGKNITITALQPGATDTNFFQEADMENTKVGKDDSKDDPAKVARDGYEALMSGKDHIVAGALKNKFMATAGKVMPETQNAKLQGGMAKPDSLQ
jgi:uncharacterized protein